MTPYLAIDPGASADLLGSCLTQTWRRQNQCRKIIRKTQNLFNLLTLHRKHQRLSLKMCQVLQEKIDREQECFRSVLIVVYSKELLKIRPHEWQKHFNIGGRSDYECTQGWKRRLKEHAQLLFPYLKVTLKTADALLLLAYAKNKHL